MPLLNREVALKATGRDDARRRIARHFRRFLDDCGIVVEISGTPPAPGTGCVLTYNETSFADVAAFGAVMWPHVDRAAAAELYGYLPWGRAAMAAAGIGMVPRGNRAATDALLDEMVAEVRQGRRVAWGGEGFLQGRDGVGRFKRGAALIAIRAQAPVIPVTFQGGHDLLPLGRIRAHPGTLRIRFGAPIATEGLTEADARALSDRLQAATALIYAELQAEGQRE